MNTVIRFQYFAVLAVLTVNLTAHFLFLISGLGWVQLKIGEWAAAWLILYPILWILPLGWMLLLRSLAEKHAPIGTKLITVSSVLPILMLVFRQIMRLMAKPWFYPVPSWIFAVLQLILIMLLWRELIVSVKKNI